MRQVAEVARALYRALASLPPALRLAAEPDYAAFVARVLANAVAARIAKAAVAGVEGRESRSLTEVVAPPPGKRQRRKRAPLVIRLSLEHILAALIETAEKRRLEFEAQVSRERSKRRGTFARNELALNLKAIIMGFSPKFADDERAAEDWAAQVLDAARIPYAKRETNLAAFKRMFAR
jgi:hypothetical protein